MIKQTIDTLKSWAKRLKAEIYTLYVAMRDPRTPAHAKLFALLVVGYALSPIDLIPDFIPVLGLLDDLILLPLGIALLRKMIPPVVMAASRRQAEAFVRTGLPASRTAAMVVVTIWALVITACLWWFANRLVYPRSSPVEETRTYLPDAETATQGNGAPHKSRDSDRGRSRER